MIADDEIRRVVGGGAFERGRAYAVQHRATVEGWDAVSGLLDGRVRGSSSAVYRTEVRLTPHPDGGRRIASTICSCPIGGDCKHVVALLLAARATLAQPSRVPAWRQALDGLLTSERVPANTGELGIQFELIEPRRTRYTPANLPDLRVGIRPVSRGSSGRWGRSGISWRELSYARQLRGFDARQLEVLSGFLALRIASAPNIYYGTPDQWIYLDELPGGQLWTLLREAGEAGVPLLASHRDGPPIGLADGAEAALEIRDREGGIEAAAILTVDGDVLAPDRLTLVGGALPSGVCWWPSGDAGLPVAARRLTLAPFAAPVSRELAGLLRDATTIVVPAAERADFLLGYYPQLAARMPVVADSEVALPELPYPVLRLTLRVQNQHALEATWAWEYRQDLARTVLPLRPAPDERVFRDRVEEQRILDTLGLGLIPDGLLASDSPLAEPRSSPPRLASRTVLAGAALLDFITVTLPALRALPDVEVAFDEQLTDLRESEEAPVVAVSVTPGAERRDWFDLAISVTLEGREVPFESLFRALALEDDLLILPDGVYLRLDSPDLDRLRVLIQEARALHDSPGGALRVSRFQAAWWAELEELGVVARQADEWRAAISAVGNLDAAQLPPPAGLTAALRPYQLEGYRWLSGLLGSGFGGVLADDMGLGKTLQVLAMIAAARETEPDAAPVLVVAPTSVVGNWASEAARFTPGLRVATVEQTQTRRGATLADMAGNADIVVTSYALFRIEYEDYDALPWSVLVLDEAQFVKNHQSKGHQLARRLAARAKFAITGTPMENNLIELWALLGIVAPGLFPSPARFTEYYRIPIERDGDSERLALLHRRIRPLMLRRTKGEVAPELPARQEQVVEVDLAPKHRALYDRYLQRERQKVLGLLGNFERNRFAIFRSLTLLRRLSLDPSLVDEAHAAIPATKLDVLFELLEDVLAEGHRVLVFSQFTGFLGRVRDRLRERAVEFCYLDGTTRKRAEVIERFRTEQIPVFLISLKAGGFGLNLTEADYCILLDPWWNPAAEAQAVDRAHRIGQTRNVMVYRLVAKNTIEEKVMALKAGKAKLFDSVIDGGELSDARLTTSDIRGLLE